jgi:hypothetical protein
MKGFTTVFCVFVFLTGLFLCGSTIADETRNQFEQSARLKATSGLLLDDWDQLYQYTWYVGSLNKNFLWTNLSNYQKDNVAYNDDTYNWTTDEKENILGHPGWDSNNSYSLGFAGKLPVSWLEKWKFGFIYNYQVSKVDFRTDTFNQESALSTLDSWNETKDDNKEHVWMLSTGRSVNDDLSISVSWYHWQNKQVSDNSIGNYENFFNDKGVLINNTKNETRNDYKLEDNGDTLSIGFDYRYDDQWTHQGYVDLDYNQLKVIRQSEIIQLFSNSGSITKVEGKDISNFDGNENRKDFGFDVCYRPIYNNNGDFWKRSSLTLNMGFHPEDGDFWGDKTKINYYPDARPTITMDYDIDGKVEWDEFNLGAQAKTTINFGERILFAWALNFDWYDFEHVVGYDNVVYYYDESASKVKSNITSYKDSIDLQRYCWSLPVAMEITFHKKLVGRLGAQWTLVDSESKSSFDTKYNNEIRDFYYNALTSYSSSKDINGTSVNNTSRNTATTYSFGLGWQFNEYLKIDLTEFTDLEDMNDWQLSAALMW